ncbi:MAG TPA: platelet-activating factor acetylhydrolase IB subunit [Planctomycetota bacterium]|jgi:beta-glucosidase
MKIRSVGLLLPLVALAGLARAADMKSTTPEPQKDAWAQKWWMPRHEQKLAEVKKLQGKVDLLWIGDSITHGWENTGKSVWDESYAKRNAFNIGFSGDRTEQVLWRLQNGEVEGIAPKLIVMMIGTNNAGHRKEKSEETAAGIKAILEELGKRLPQSKVLLLAIFPRGAKTEDALRKLNDETNKLIAPYADNKRVFFLDINAKFLQPDGTLTKDIMPDLLHPNPKGYKIWAEAVEPTIEKLMSDAK